jgi:AraC-like DNA-binding protein
MSSDAFDPRHPSVASAISISAPTWCELSELRELLRSRQGRVTIGEAARELAVSSRSLQRALASRGTTFRAEQLAARFRAACTLFQSTELKVASIAAHLGVSERALRELVHARAGVPPHEQRARLRAAS